MKYECRKPIEGNENNEWNNWNDETWSDMKIFYNDIWNSEE